MKKNYLALIVCVICLVSASVQAQKKKKPFKGIVKYKLEYERTDEPLSESEKAEFPKSVEVKIMGNKSSITQEMMGVKMVMIIDGDKKQRTSLLYIQDKKYAIIENEFEIDLEMDDYSKPEFTYLDDTKVIAGYTCKKAESKVMNEYDEEEIITFYYSDQLASSPINFSDINFRGLDGLAMRYKTTKDNMIVKYKAVEVIKGKVKIFDFLIPDGLNMLSKDEFEEQVKKDFNL